MFCREPASIVLELLKNINCETFSASNKCGIANTACAYTNMPIRLSVSQWWVIFILGILFLYYLIPNAGMRGFQTGTSRLSIWTDSQATNTTLKFATQDLRKTILFGNSHSKDESSRNIPRWQCGRAQSNSRINKRTDNLTFSKKY